MTNKTMADLAKNFQNIERQKASAAINELHEGLVSDIPRAVLPEEVFKEHFLDFFMNPDKYKDTPILAQWISISGGPYNEVDIIDREGKVIFTAPSAIMRPKTDFDKLTNVNFHKIAVTYNNKKMITSAQATNYINTVLAGLDKTIHADVKEYIMRWDQIFDRYRNPNQQALNSTPTTENKPKPKPQLTSKPDEDIFSF